ncbi:MAG: hypothetical protein ACKO3B_08285 [Bacteroidota bacterium]
MRVMSRYMLRSLPQYVGEFLIIFLGITMSWWFDDWREEIEERKQEAMHLRNLVYNLESDSTTFMEELAFIQTSEKRLRYLSQALNGGDRDSIGYNLTSMILIPEFHPNRSEFEAIKATGEIRLIKDPALVREIMSHYEVEYGRLESRVFFYQKAIMDYAWDFAMDNLDMSKAFNSRQQDNFRLNLDNSQEHFEMKNKITLCLLATKITRERFQQSLERITHLRQLISARLAVIDVKEDKD